MPQMVISPRDRVYGLKPGTDMGSFLTAHPGWKLVKGRQPSQPTLERWVDNCMAKTTDGCTVEPDGRCGHGHPSWLLVLGYI